MRQSLITWLGVSMILAAYHFLTFDYSSIATPEFQEFSIQQPVNLNFKVDSNLPHSDVFSTTIKDFYGQTVSAGMKVSPVLCQPSPQGPVCNAYSEIKIVGSDEIAPEILSLLRHEGNTLVLFYNSNRVKTMDVMAIRTLLAHQFAQLTLVPPAPIAQKQPEFI